MPDEIKTPAFVATLLLTTILAMQAWALLEIVNLKVDVAAIKATLALTVKPVTAYEK